MDYTTIGTSQMKAAKIALGLMRIPNITPEKTVNLLDTAFDNGINYFDLADVYGAGKSEQMFGDALKKAAFSRNQIFIQSKTGINRNTNSSITMFDFSKKHILTSVDESLKRLQTDYLDLLILHRPDALMEPDEINDAFNQLLQAGKVRYFGVSNFNSAQLDYLQSGLDMKLQTNQMQFGLKHTEMVDFGLFTNMNMAEGIDHDQGMYPYLMKHKMTLQAWSPYQYGNFAGFFIGNKQFPDLNDQLTDLANHYHTNTSAIAAAWILRLPMSAQVIVGTTNPDHLLAAIAGANIKLTREEWYQLYIAAIGHPLP